ncbi:hypothetical protein AMC83_CH01948 [Rhizobium phaseoli]|uniref:hypothetical protein n=1 Tax=Rhizobium phaseoli TaxID=396 RepID=UPI0007F0FF3A|nr:hypothetical protein [Rhizobium phaseoli]ANL71931.1 hypothetical protein AMC83_CH01948 [Rhizobium phaseoli]
MDLLNPKAPQTPTPEQAQFETQIDKIANTETKRVKQPDGTWAMVRDKLPLSAEDQAYADQLQSLRDDSLAFIRDLTENYDRSKIPWLDQYLKDYEESGNNTITRSAATTANEQEKALARFGQADSTAATQARAQRFATTSNQRVQLGRDMSAIEQNARDSELSKQGSLYSLASNALNNQTNMQLGSAAGLINSGLAQQANTQNFNNTLAATLGANNKAQFDAQQAGFNNLAALTSLAAAPFTGGASLALPSLFNSAKAGTSGGWASYGDGTRINWNSGRLA